jgi:hypothetical protein
VISPLLAEVWGEISGRFEVVANSSILAASAPKRIAFRHEGRSKDETVRHDGDIP